MENFLKKALQQNQLNIAPDAEAKLIHFLKLMQTWNRIFNLTAITDPREMVYLHLIDSLTVQPFLHGQSLLDVGTGAGLPGIPLAIINPQQHWVLLDKNSKKTRFLTQVIAELKLKNVEPVHSRSEDFHPSHGFDSIISRALGSLHMFATTTQHLLNSEGVLIAMKGKYPSEELNVIPADFEIKEIVPLPIQGMNIERHIVRLMKK